MPILSEDVARQLSLTVEDFDPGNETQAPFQVRVTVENASGLELDSCDTGAPLNLRITGATPRPAKSTSSTVCGPN